MITWTESAKKLWADYMEETKAALEASGADPQEVWEDLKRHIDAEAAASASGVVAGEDLRKILSKFGRPEQSPEHPVKPEPRPAGESGLTGRRRWGKFIAVGLLFFAVLLPVITIVFEAYTGISADVLFDPMPTWFHVVLVALVPIGNACIWAACWRSDSGRRPWSGWLAGWVTGVCLYYSLMYILILPYALIGVLYFGLGLIPLTPCLALIATLVLCSKYRKSGGLQKWAGYSWGVVLAVFCLLLLQLPESLNFYGLSLAGAEDQAIRDRGVRVLRWCGNRTTMLRACYGWFEHKDIFNPLDLLAIAGENRVIPATAAREVFYRVTGEAFNSVPPPTFYTRAGRWTDLDDEYVWDEGLGGDQVAGRIKGLVLLSSRMDATTEPAAGLAYCEWTMEFKNVSAVQREARAEVALPPGAVVSRVTLWIDGEEREAAFGGRVQTRAAYREEAVIRRRDPLLVTTCGPDRVLVQCFPIQPSGGVMKIKLGITAPLMLDTMAEGRLIWPRFLERNFGIAPTLKHSLWIQQPGTNNNMIGAFDSLAETNLWNGVHATIVHRPANIDRAWAPTDTAGQYVLQTIRPAKVIAPKRIVVVIDGSAGMKQHVGELRQALGQLPESSEVAVMVASDMSPPARVQAMLATAEMKAQLQKDLGRGRFVGGQDNLPALESAWDLADASESGAVVWVHLAEPVLLSSEGGLGQRLERDHQGTRLYEIQLNNGPDRLVERLDSFPGVEQVSPVLAGENCLERLLGRWSGRIQTFAYARQLTNDVGGSPGACRAGKDLVRLWARDEALRLAEARQGSAAASLAARSQLVTPLTGAVVLETKAQYDLFNLSPADPGTVPQIPEPNNFTIIALFVALLAFWRRRRRGRSGATCSGRG